MANVNAPTTDKSLTLTATAFSAGFRDAKHAQMTASTHSNVKSAWMKERKTSMGNVYAQMETS